LSDKATDEEFDTKHFEAIRSIAETAQAIASMGHSAGTVKTEERKLSSTPTFPVSEYSSPSLLSLLSAAAASRLKDPSESEKQLVDHDLRSPSSGDFRQFRSKSETKPRFYFNRKGSRDCWQVSHSTLPRNAVDHQFTQTSQLELTAATSRHNYQRLLPAASCQRCADGDRSRYVAVGSKRTKSAVTARGTQADPKRPPQNPFQVTNSSPHPSSFPCDDDITASSWKSQIITVSKMHSSMSMSLHCSVACQTTAKWSSSAMKSVVNISKQKS
jgi:hypothetical protein